MVKRILNALETERLNQFVQSNVKLYVVEEKERLTI